MIRPCLMVHGGAWNIPRKAHKAHRDGVEKALQAGRAQLAGSDDPLKAVLAAIRVLEDDPTFDAGTGSFLNRNAEVEMDAGIMLGRDLSCGAVAAIRNVRHPVDAAELVRTKTQHVLLVGEGACEFARQQKMAHADTAELVVGREKELYLKLAKMDKVRIKSFFERRDAITRGRDTVGCVAINSKGEVAAATSTGGTPYKLPGRVGDSPIPGAGYYADDALGAVSSTGWGEGILRVTLARDALMRLREVNSIEQALRHAVSEMQEKVGGDGGLIAIDRNGNPAFTFNTPYMAVGLSGIEKTEFAIVAGKDHPSCLS